MKAATEYIKMSRHTPIDLFAKPSSAAWFTVTHNNGPQSFGVYGLLLGCVCLASFEIPKRI